VNEDSGRVPAGHLFDARSSGWLQVLEASGRVGALLAAGEAAALGDAGSWPVGLRRATVSCLAATVPAVVWWGVELRAVYNDACIPLLGHRHPAALGLPGATGWPEGWAALGAPVTAALTRCQTTWCDDQPLTVVRDGRRQEAHFGVTILPMVGRDLEVTGVYTTLADTSMRVAAARRLELSHELLDAAQRLARVGGWEIDVGTWRMAGTDEVHRLTGTSSAALSEEGVEALLARVPDADRVRVETTLRRAARTGESLTLEHGMILPSGSERTVRMVAEAVRDHAGRVIALRGSTQDVTEEWLARQRLAESEERFRAAFDAAPHGMTLVSPDRRLVRANRAYQEMVGRTLEELVGTDPLDLLVPEDRPLVDERFAAVVSPAHRAYRIEVHYQRPDGTVVPAEVSVTLLTRPSGEARLVVGHIEDLRPRRAAEEATRAAEDASRAAHLARQLAAREHAVATELQRRLLPAQVGSTAGLDISACYRAGVEGVAVGGDWYDVIDLGVGRAGLVIGDVMGRGVAAAAVMGQLRAAVRGYARLDLPPAEILGLLDGLVAELGDEQLVTCVYGVYDPSERTLMFANAGHLPPLLLTARGADRLGPIRYAPLGAGLPPAHDQVVDLVPGDVLALYTDGLVEERGSDIDAGIEALAAAVARRATGGDLKGVADEIVGSLRPPGAGDDDIALVVVRVADQPTPVRGVVELIVDGDVTKVREFRRQAWVAARDWGIRPDRAEQLVLAASELATNALVHGRPPARLRLRRVGNEAVVELFDRSPVWPRPRTAGPQDEGGRGLQLVAALADRWGVRAVEEGKVVWASFRP
jgi:PAS domain S-box-containing protein